jgi:hypothetical protein
MARPLRLEFPGALYHITARGNAQQAIFVDDTDRQHFLQLLGREILQQQWRCYVYCLMGNHLSKKMGSGMSIDLFGRAA